MIKQGNVYYYSKDGLGSIVNLTDATGQITESYTYDEYGNLTSAPSQIGNRYLYTSREYDPEINLYYYRARYYDPTIGRFLQTDPIGYYDGINLYTYAGNNPINYTDPFGYLSCQSLLGGALVGAGGVILSGATTTGGIILGSGAIIVGGTLIVLDIIDLSELIDKLKEIIDKLGKEAEDMLTPPAEGAEPPQEGKN